MSECSHNCSTCGENCSSRTQDKKSFLEALAPESSVKKVIGVVSGKGGVGKSLVTSFHSVSDQNCFTAPAITGPLQMTGSVS